MNTGVIIEQPPFPTVNAGAVFDRLAAAYDEIFTNSVLGRAQRERVWAVAERTFGKSDNLLELNCGTGEDAIFLAKRGASVVACDASSQMIAKAEERLSRESSLLPIVFCQLATERLSDLRPEPRFDGAFSNFSGLNCVADLSRVATTLADLVKPGARLLLCFSTRLCMIEIGYYLFRRQWRKAFRRCKGQSTAKLSGLNLPVYYPTLRQIRRSFAPHFVFRSCVGIGVALPPSYCEAWASQHPRLLSFLRNVEPLFATAPLLRVTGDHMLLCFERVSA